MNARSNKTSDAAGWPFREPGTDTESNVNMNQRMIGQLLQRKNRAADQPAYETRALIALGIEVSESREEKSGFSLKEAAKRGGLDPAFLAIVEAGKAVPEEIGSPGVLASLARCADSSIEELRSAMSMDQSYLVEEAPGLLGGAVVMVQALFSLYSPSFLREATAFKSMTGHPSSIAETLFDDPEAKVSYRIGGLSEGEPLSMIFYEFQNPDAPLEGWAISVRSGLEELLSGKTDDQGVFRFPHGMEDFPENSHMLIRKSG